MLDKNGAPTGHLQELLQLFGLPHEGTLESVVDVTQKAWLRRPGSEIWEISEMHEDKRDAVMPIFEKLDCLKEVSPARPRYDYAVVFGALVTRVRSRFAFLVEQWKRGIRFDEIVFLGGARPLDPELESTERLLDQNNGSLQFKKDWQLIGELPKTEYEMMKMVFDQADLPEDFLEHVRITFVDAPMRTRPDGTLGRPNTGDTVRTWLEMNPQPGTCLFSSNQPYVGYQDSVARTLMPKTFAIETVGAKASDGLLVAAYLDCITRWLYQERKRRS